MKFRCIHVAGRLRVHLGDPPGSQGTHLLTLPASAGANVQIEGSVNSVFLLGEDGEVYQTGDLTQPQGLSASRVTRPAEVARWLCIAAGGFHCLALGTDGEIYAWGRNWEGQLGIGGGVESRPTPTRVVRPTGVERWSALAAGYMHSLAIGTDGGLYAWGANANGLFGDPYLPQQPVPTRIEPIGNLQGFAVIQPGSESSRLPDGTFRIRFKTEFNRSYLIQYSDNVAEWKTALPAVLGTGGVVEWIDDGPPRTETHPAEHPSRYYRIALEP
jgi:hypothetical protein